MKITYIDWHEGYGYAVELLPQLTTVERSIVFEAIKKHYAVDPDWRDVQAAVELTDVDTAAFLRSVLERGTFDQKIRALFGLRNQGLINEDVVLSTCHEWIPVIREQDGIHVLLDTITKLKIVDLYESMFDRAMTGTPGSWVAAAYYAIAVGAVNNPNDHTRMQLYTSLQSRDVARQQAAKEEYLRMVNRK